MRNKSWLIFSLMGVSVYIALLAGCQQPTPPPPPPPPEHYNAGYGAAKNFIANQLADYRIVIMLKSMNSDQRGHFLKGFSTAYTDATQSEKGQKYTATLSGAVESDTFEEAKKRGLLHAKDKTTDAQIQSLIKRSFGISRSASLAWKAGYIEGFKDALPDSEKADDKTGLDNLYKKAEAMYEALRAATGL